MSDSSQSHEMCVHTHAQTHKHIDTHAWLKITKHTHTHSHIWLKMTRGLSHSLCLHSANQNASAAYWRLDECLIYFAGLGQRVLLNKVKSWYLQKASTILIMPIKFNWSCYRSFSCLEVIAYCRKMNVTPHKQNNLFQMLTLINFHNDLKQST